MRDDIHGTSTLIPSRRLLTAAVAVAFVAVSGVAFGPGPALTQEAAPADNAKPEGEKVARRPVKKVRQDTGEPHRSAAVQPAPHPPAPVLNVCILNRQTVMQKADINVASTKRLEDLRQAAQNEINTTQRSLEAEFRALTEEKRPPTDAVYQGRKAALDARVQALTAAAEMKRRQIDVTRDEVNRQISVAALPILQGIEKDKACTLLLSQEAVLDGSGVTDITGSLIEAMNAQLHAVPFSLADLGSVTPQR